MTGVREWGSIRVSWRPRVGGGGGPRAVSMPAALERRVIGKSRPEMGAGDIDGVAGDLVAALTAKADFGG